MIGGSGFLGDWARGGVEFWGGGDGWGLGELGVMGLGNGTKRFGILFGTLFIIN